MKSTTTPYQLQFLDCEIILKLCEALEYSKLSKQSKQSQIEYLRREVRNAKEHMLIRPKSCSGMMRGPSELP